MNISSDFVALVMFLRLRRKKTRTVLQATLFILYVTWIVAPASAQVQTTTIHNYRSIAVAQDCPMWCWAAGAAMLTRSQGVDIPQEYFVWKIFGGLICAPSGGSFEPIRVAITGNYHLADGTIISITGAYHYGMPTDSDGMLKSIKEDRPFIFAWGGHVYVGYGLKWHPASVTGTHVVIDEILLIDPFFKMDPRRPEFTSFVVQRDAFSFRPTDGTFELLVSRTGMSQQVGDCVEDLLYATPDGRKLSAHLEPSDCDRCGTPLEKTTDPRWISSARAAPLEFVGYVGGDQHLWYSKVHAHYSGGSIEFWFEHRGPANMSSIFSTLPEDKFPDHKYNLGFYSWDGHIYNARIKPQEPKLQPCFQVRRTG